MNTVWILYNDYGFEGYGEPIAVFSFCPCTCDLLSVRGMTRDSASILLKSIRKISPCSIGNCPGWELVEIPVTDNRHD